MILDPERWNKQIFKATSLNWILSLFFLFQLRMPELRSLHETKLWNACLNTLQYSPFPAVSPEISSCVFWLFFFSQICICKQYNSLCSNDKVGFKKRWYLFLQIAEGHKAETKVCEFSQWNRAADWDEYSNLTVCRHLLFCVISVLFKWYWDFNDNHMKMRHKNTCSYLSQHKT